MRILRRQEVVGRIGYSAMHLWRLERNGLFPRRVKLGPNAVGWLEHEIEDWIKQRIAERDRSVSCTSADPDHGHNQGGEIPR